MKIIFTCTLILFLFPLLFCFVSCEKSKTVKIAITKQAETYTAIYGLITNGTTTQTISVSETTSKSDANANGLDGATLQLFSEVDTLNFVNGGGGLYSCIGGIEPRGFYVFNCSYNSKNYSYAFSTGDYITADSLIFDQTLHAGNNVNLRVKIQDPLAFMLIKLYISKTAGKDTLWEDLAKVIPVQTTEVNFLSPYSANSSDSLGFGTVSLLKSSPLFLDKDWLVKVILYSIDQQTADYLNKLKSYNAYSYNPLSVSPPDNYFAFTNDALGIIIPALVTERIFVVP